MLTKDLLRYSHRKGRLYPHSLKGSDKDALKSADLLLSIFKAGKGQSLLELKSSLESHLGHLTELEKAFEKLLIDRCAWEEPSSEIEDQRWEAIFLGESLRTENMFETMENYRAEVAETFQMSTETLDELIYSDLPENKKVAEFKEISAEMLIHRYSSAQIQGLLLHAKKITVDIEDFSLAEKRTFFRLIKFFQLLATVKKEGLSTTRVELSGPLDILDSATKYGMKLANFFPYILQLSNFKLEADINLNRKNYTLKVDDSCGIKSHYGHRGSYVPEELLAIKESFEEKNPDYQLLVADDYFHLGRESYCFPDFLVKHKKNEKDVYIELFHRWHASQLFHRLKAIEKEKPKNLLVGVCRSALKKDEFSKLTTKHEIFQQYGFSFRDFPTTKQILSAVNQLDSL